LSNCSHDHETKGLTRYGLRLLQNDLGVAQARRQEQQ